MSPTSIDGGGSWLVKKVIIARRMATMRTSRLVGGAGAMNIIKERCHFGSSGLNIKCFQKAKTLLFIALQHTLNHARPIKL